MKKLTLLFMLLSFAAVASDSSTPTIQPTATAAAAPVSIAAKPAACAPQRPQSLFSPAPWAPASKVLTAHDNPLPQCGGDPNGCDGCACYSGLDYLACAVGILPGGGICTICSGTTPPCPI